MKLSYLLLVLVFISLPYRVHAGALPPYVFYQIGNWQLLDTECHYLDLGLGVFDATENNHGHSAGEARLELRIGQKLGFVGPAVGLLATTDGGWLGYAGLYADIVYKHLVITPILSVGGYKEGDGKDLGGTTAVSFSPRFVLAVREPCPSRSANGSCFQCRPARQKTRVRKIF